MCLYNNFKHLLRKPKSHKYLISRRNRSVIISAYLWQWGGWQECSCPGLPVESRGTPHCEKAHCLWPWSCTAPPGGKENTVHCEGDIILDHHEIIQFKEDLSAIPNPPLCCSLSPSANTEHHTLIKRDQSRSFRWRDEPVSEEDSDAYVSKCPTLISYQILGPLSRHVNEEAN